MSEHTTSEPAETPESTRLEPVATDAPPPASRPAMYRIALFLVLIVALCLLAYDQAARFQARGAYDTVDGLLAEEDEGPQLDLSASAARTPTEIHRLLARAPDSGERRADDFLETYGWRGVFNTYRVYIVYSGATLNLEDPNDSEPLLMKVGYNREP